MESPSSSTSSEHVQRCSACKKENSRERELCLYCGRSLAAAQENLPANVSASPPEESVHSASGDQVDCLKCNRSNPAGRLNCIFCATFLPNANRDAKIIENVERIAKVMGDKNDIAMEKARKAAISDMFLFFIASPLIAFKYLRLFSPFVKVKKWGYMDPFDLAIDTVVGGMLAALVWTSDRTGSAAGTWLGLYYLLATGALWVLFFRRHRLHQEGFILGYSFQVVGAISWGMLCLCVGSFAIATGNQKLAAVTLLLGGGLLAFGIPAMVRETNDFRIG